jgi:hypothetical protein
VTGASLIDLVLSYWENISPDDVDNTQRRARILLYTQMTVDEIRRSHPWPFAMTSTSLVVAPGDMNVDLPTDFDSITRYGGLYRTSDGALYVEIPIAELQYARNMGDEGGLVYAIFEKKIQTLVHTSGVDFTLNYKRYADAIADDGATELEDAIPTRYHHTVVLPGVITKAQVAKGDVRDFERAYNHGMAQMVTAEMTQQSSVKQLPMHPAITMNLGGSF